MPAREDLLFGMLAVQTGLIDAVAFLDTWGALAEGGPPLPELLVLRGLILPEDREHLAYLTHRKTPSADAAPRTAVTVMGERADDGGRYHYLDVCGTGGMGDVWRARDTRLGRDVAIKELKPALADDEVIRARFLREARVTCQLDHPGIVPLYDILPDVGGRPRYAMRLLRGRTLAEAIRAMHGRRQAGEDMSLERAGLLQAFVTVCNTVAYAHSRGVLHRDLKPANVQLGDFGEVVVLDWGLAGAIRDGDTPTEEPDARVTLPGHVFGTPEYMAPEQASGDIAHIDQRSDIYGLGAILYQLLTGSPPFRGASRRETLALVRECEPTPVRELYPDVPAGLEAICHKALSKLPESRHADAASLGAAVLHWQESERLAAEEALRASEERFRTLFEAVPQFLWIARPDGWMEYSNSRSAFPGRSRRFDEIAGTSWRGYVYPDDLPRMLGAWEASQVDGAAFETEYRWQVPDGSYRWCLSRAVPLRDGEGRIVQWFGSSTDIHDLKQAMRERDEALEQARASEAHFRTLVEAVPQGVWIAGRDGNLEYVSHGWRREGEQTQPPERFLALGWRDFIHPEDLSRLDLARKQAHDNGTVYECECRERHTSEPWRWKLCRGVPMRDAEGRIEKWFGTTTDIHDLKQAVQERDEALAQARANAQRLNLLTEMIPHSVWTATPEGVLDFMNRHSLDLAGFTLQEMGRDGWQLVVHPDDLTGTRDRWHQALVTGAPFETECRVRDASGEYRWYLSRAVAIRDEQGRVTQWFGTNTDIDALKRAEMQRLAAQKRPPAS